MSKEPAKTEVQDGSDFRLTDEQAEEVRRRMADSTAKTMTLAAFNEHVERRSGRETVS